MSYRSEHFSSAVFTSSVVILDVRSDFVFVRCCSGLVIYLNKSSRYVLISCISKRGYCLHIFFVRSRMILEVPWFERGMRNALRCYSRHFDCIQLGRALSTSGTITSVTAYGIPFTSNTLLCFLC